MKTYNYTLYDSLIITAAIEANCTILYSEDLQHNQQIGKLGN
jgi:predicted nucleic acid-binding protein